jgi:hypothetical protein
VSVVRFCGCVRCSGGCSFGVVTFLFTDVEGSTRRWGADAERMRTALAAHDEALRAAIEAPQNVSTCSMLTRPHGCLLAQPVLATR